MDLSILIGMIGVVLGLSAYILLQLQKLRSDDYCYLLMNLASSSSLVISLVTHWNLAGFAINSIWIGVTIMGLWNKYHKASPPV